MKEGKGSRWCVALRFGDKIISLTEAVRLQHTLLIQVGKGGSQITNHGLISNTVTDHDKKCLVELRITNLILWITDHDRIFDTPITNHGPVFDLITDHEKNLYHPANSVFIIVFLYHYTTCKLQS